MMKAQGPGGRPVTIEELEAMVPPLRKFTVTYRNPAGEVLRRDIVAHKEGSTSSGMLLFTRLDINRLNVALHERMVWGITGVIEYAEDCDYVDPSKSTLSVGKGLASRLGLN